MTHNTKSDQHTTMDSPRETDEHRPISSVTVAPTQDSHRPRSATTACDRGLEARPRRGHRRYYLFRFCRRTARP